MQEVATLTLLAGRDGAEDEAVGDGGRVGVEAQREALGEVEGHMIDAALRATSHQEIVFKVLLPTPFFSFNIIGLLKMLVSI